MILDILLAFLEGIGLVLSPCILPVLPFVLASGSQGGKARPFGVIAGFILAFTLFAILSRLALGSLQLDSGLLRNAALILLALAALMLLSTRATDSFGRFSGKLAGWADRKASQIHSRSDFVTGMAVGSLIGLVWTPCAGPILAAAVIGIAHADHPFAAFAQIFAFALGAGVPMLAIALFGHRLSHRLGWAKRHSLALRRILAGFMLLTVLLISQGWDRKLLALSTRPIMQDLAPVTGLINPLPTPYAAPELTGLTGWHNSDPLTLASLRGKVVLIDFWTYSCINCVRTIPYLQAYHTAFADKGLVIIGIHTPEFPFERDPANVAKAIRDLGVTWPVAQDNANATWNAYRNRYWPAHYLINREGQVVYRHFGEGKNAEMENNIRYLLGLNADQITQTPAQTPFFAGATPETYLGTARAARQTTPDSNLPLHGWNLSSGWQQSPQFATATAPDATLNLHFFAGKVYLVLGTDDGKPRTLSVQLDGKPVSLPESGKDLTASTLTASTLTIDSHRLYHILSLPSPRAGTLTLTTQQGTQAYAFTFGR